MIKINVSREVVKDWYMANTEGEADVELEIEPRVDMMVEFAKFVVNKVSQQIKVKYQKCQCICTVDLDLEFDPD